MATRASNVKVIWKMKQPVEQEDEDKNDDQVGRIEDPVPVPIAVFPARGFSRFEFVSRENRDKITAVEFAIQVGVTDPGAFKFLDPMSTVIKVHLAITRQIETRGISAGGDGRAR